MGKVSTLECKHLALEEKERFLSSFEREQMACGGRGEEWKESGEDTVAPGLPPLEWEEQITLLEKRYSLSLLSL